MLERRSALSAILDPAATAAAAPTSVLSSAHRLGEVRGHTLLQIAGFRSTMASIEAKVGDLTGVRIPDRIGKVERVENLKVMRTGPEQLWIIARNPGDLSARLGAAIPATMGGMIDLSHARTRIYIEGPRATQILAKGIALDLAPNVFALDHFALTSLDHTPVLVYRSMTDRYEIWSMRTFARTVWDWLADAALEFEPIIVTRPKEGQSL